MNRKRYLKTTAAATATAAGMAGAAPAAEPAAAPPSMPAVVTRPVMDLVLTTPWPRELPGVGDAAQRLARRIETATGGRYRIHVRQGALGSVEAIMTGLADLTFASEHTNLAFDRGFAYFAGLPCRSGLGPEDTQAWLAAGGGQMLWDDFAAGYGVKPMLAGHTGSRPGLWSTRPFGDVGELAGARVFVRGLGQATIAALGAQPTQLPASDLAPALADGRLTAAEWAGPFASLALGLQNGAKLYYRDGVNTGGTAFTLGVRHGLWQRMAATDRAILEGCAADELVLSLAEARARDPIAGRILAEKRQVRMPGYPAGLARALSAAAEAVVAEVAAESAAARRIGDSYSAFRKLVAEEMPDGEPAA